MGFLSAPILRLALFISFAVDVAFAFPIRLAIHAPHPGTRAVEDSGNAVNSVNQSGTGTATDGAGSGFDIPAILWISFGLVVGSFLTFGGMRLWRMTTAFAIGLVFALCVWVAIVNAVNSDGISDTILTLVTLSFFVVGSIGGLFKFCRLAGLTALSILGGMSLGIRISLMREGLLLHPAGLNWIIIVVCSAAGFVATLLRQRIGIALSCTFTGTFLFSLGVDLAVNQQKGVSIGLRHLLDGNTARVASLNNIPYKPPISTQIILSLSIALALAMAYVQVRFFSGYVEEPGRIRPFTEYISSVYPPRSADKMDMDTLRLPLQRPPATYSSNRFSL